MRNRRGGRRCNRGRSVAKPLLGHVPACRDGKGNGRTIREPEDLPEAAFTRFLDQGIRGGCVFSQAHCVVWHSPGFAALSRPALPPRNPNPGNLADCLPCRTNRDKEHGVVKFARNCILRLLTSPPAGTRAGVLKQSTGGNKTRTPACFAPSLYLAGSLLLHAGVIAALTLILAKAGGSAILKPEPFSAVASCETRQCLVCEEPPPAP